MKGAQVVAALLLAIAPGPAAAQMTTQMRAQMTTQTAAGDDESQPAAFVRDERARRVRVRFDPGSRVTLGGGWAPQLSQLSSARGGAADRGYLETGVGYRHLVSGDDEAVAWKVYHRALDARVTLGAGEGLWLEATGYRFRLLRHSDDGTLLWPANPPRTLPFPFNVGFEATLGQVLYRDAPGGFDAEIGIAEPELLLDLWRQRRLGSHLQLGVGPRYDLRLSSRQALPPQPAEHLVTPFSGGSLAFRHESSDGHQAIDLRCRGAYRLRVDSGWAPWFEAHISYEAIILALNDLPLSTFVATRYRYTDDHLPTIRRHELRGSVGLRFALPIDR